jgi:hypothetical protein
MEGAQREKGPSTQLDGHVPLPDVTNHHRILPPHESYRLLESAAWELPCPARQRILVVALEVSMTTGRHDIGELVGIEVIASRVDFERRIHVRQDDVASARRLERRNQQAVVATGVHLRDGRARVGTRAVGVEPLDSGAL